MPERDSKGRLLPGHTISKGNKGGPGRPPEKAVLVDPDGPGKPVKASKRPKDAGPAPGDVVPRGKPTKFKNLLYQATSDSERQALIRQVFDQARNGCMNSQALLLERVVARVKPTAAPIPFSLDLSNGPAAAGLSVLNACADGTLGSDQTKDLLAAITDVVELANLEKLTEEVDSLKQSIEKLLEEGGRR